MPARFLYHRLGPGYLKREGNLGLARNLIDFKVKNFSMKFPLNGDEAVLIHNPEKARKLFPELLSVIKEADVWVVEVRASLQLRRRQTHYVFAVDRAGADEIAAGLERTCCWQ